MQNLGLVIKDGDGNLLYPSDTIVRETKDGTLYQIDVSGKLLLSETDGGYNKLILNELLSLGNVTLKKGTYPVDPTIIVDNVTFDLNNSCLRSTKEKYAGHLIRLKGDNPIIRNGEVCGNYNTADDEPGYEFYEKERLIAVYEYNNALIENMNVHNCWGYAICGKHPSWGTEAERLTVNNVTKITTHDDGRSTEFVEYLSDKIKIPKGYLYTTLYGGIGYNYIISQKEVVYKFYDSDNKSIGSASGIPRIMVNIPAGAAYLTVRTFCIDEYKRARIGFYNMPYYSCTIRNCTIHNNSSLGVVGLPYGITKAIDCLSYENGKPRSSATLTSRTTTGFIDIEDEASPIFVMDGCISKNEGKLAMIGAYNLTVNNCLGNICIYRGWAANVSNCVGKVGAFSYNVPTVINVNNCIYTAKNDVSVNWTGNNNTFIGCYPSNLSKEKNFIIKRSKSYDPELIIDGLIIGKYLNPYSFSGWAGISIKSLAKGSDFVVEWNTGENSDNPSKGGYSVKGNCYGLKATCAFYPNGNSINESVFTPTHSFGCGTNENDAWTGEYNDCTFNLDSGSMFYAKIKKVKSVGKCLIFRNCIINNANNYLFLTNITDAVSKDYSIKFINCTIADETKLFKTAPTDFNYYIINEENEIKTTRVFNRGVVQETITENMDYNVRIKALERQMNISEGN